MSKKLLYISVHSVLEYDELSLFTELGYDCFSLGAYINPEGHYELPRPGIKDMPYHPELIDMVKDMPRTELTWEFINNFDVIVVMDGAGATNILKANWGMFKEKPTIWRTIGQSMPHTENSMKPLRKEGMKIVRYSPMEKKISGYIGEDAMIRFYKDPNEFGSWTGINNRIINLTQTLKGRRDFCGYDVFEKINAGFPIKIYGSGNEDLGEWNGGVLTYEGMKRELRNARAYLYFGTWPASYTLGFIEAWMTGVPVVAVGTDLWQHKNHGEIKYYEIPKLIDNGDDGFYSGDIEQLKKYLNKLLDDKDYARQIGEAGRQKAIKIFGKETIKEQWNTLLKGIWA